MPCGSLSLENSIVVVTGAGSGINLAFAKLAVQQGAYVVVADLKLTKDAEGFMKQERAKCKYVRCDVTKRKDLENLIHFSEKEFGNVPDVYIAGAGVFEPKWSNWWDDSEDNGYSQVEINVNHPLKLARIATRSLVSRNKKGVVLITSSLAGYLGTYSAPLYCATKHAIIGFVRSMADLDRLESVKIVAVAPGMVQTPLWTDHPDKMKQFGYDPATSITPDAVAEAMIKLTTSGEFGGGTCLEVSADGTRALGTWNIDPPKAAGTSVPQDIIDNGNYAPMIALMKMERGKEQ